MRRFEHGKKLVGGTHHVLDFRVGPNYVHERRMEAWKLHGDAGIERRMCKGGGHTESGGPMGWNGLIL